MTRSLHGSTAGLDRAKSPKVGKSLLVANLALSLAAGSDCLDFPIPKACRVLAPVRITDPAVGKPSGYDAPSHG